MYSSVLNKYNPVDKRSHSILGFFAEDLNEDQQIAFVQAIFNRGSWLLPVEISKTSQSTKLKDFAEERFYEIFNSWVNERLEHNSNIVIGKRRSNIPNKLIAEYNEAIFSIKNLNFPPKIMAILEMLLQKSPSAYMKSFYEASFSLVIEDFSEEEIEVFSTYFIDKYLVNPSTKYINFLYGFLEKLTYSPKIFSLSFRFIDKLNLLSDSFKKEDYKNDYILMLSILHIELIDKKQLDLSNSDFESLIEETISSLDRRSLDNLFFFRFLNHFNYPFNSLDIELEVQGLFRGIQDNISKIDTSDELRRHQIIFHYIESDNLYFELLLFYLSLSSKEFAKETMINFIKLLDISREFYSSSFLWFDEYLNYKIINGEIFSLDRVGVYVQIHEEFFKSKIKELNYEFSSEELLNKYKNGFIHVKALRNFKEIGDLVYDFRKQKTKVKTVLVDNSKIEVPSLFLIESINYSVLSRGSILRLIPIDEEFISIVSKYQLKAYFSSLEMFFIDKASHFLNCEHPIQTRSYLFRNLFTFSYFDDYKFRLSPESFRDILQEFRPHLYEQLYIIPKTKEKSFNDLVKAYENETILKGLIKSHTKGGMFVEVLDSIAFLPGSQIELKPVRDFDSYIGKTMDFKVVKVIHEFRNVVVSRKAVIETNLEQQRTETLRILSRGQVLEGIVKNIASYGVFVDIGGVDGMVHRTDLSWSRINHPNEIIERDQKLNVVILDFDEDKTRIQLGIKQLSPDPWGSFVKQFDVGDKIKGKVVVLENYGAFIEVAEGVEGLIHVSEMSWSIHLGSAEEFVNVGDEVEAVVLTMDKEERKMSLSIKQMTPDPWTDINTKYPVGSRHKGIVRNLTNFGVFVELEKGIDGLIYISDLSWTKKIKHPNEFTNIGDELEVVVLELDVEGRKLSLGYKQTEENPWDKYECEFAVETKHTASIDEMVDKGATIKFNENVIAFIPTLHLYKEDGNPLSKGEEAEFQIIEFNKKAKKVVASHLVTYKPEKIPKSRIEKSAKIYTTEVINQIERKLDDQVVMNYNSTSDIITVGSKIMLEPFGKEAAWFCIGKNTSTCQRINQDSIFAKRLINKRVGDVIDFGNGFKVLLIL